MGEQRKTSSPGMLGAELSNTEVNYGTTNQRSFRHYLTAEVLPKMDNYSSNGARPDLDDLLNHTVKIQEPGMADPPDNTEQSKKKGKVIKFGWLEGVLMRCLLNIWGVMLFLRLTWMVGQCGLWQALAVVVSANTVTTITAISMSAVATNGLIQGGGVYYMISRSLGPEFGGSIGLMFTAANSIAVSTYVIGFVESLQDMLDDYFDVQMIDGGVNDIRAIGAATLVALMALAIVGMDWVTRVQMVLLFLLIGSQIDMIIGFFVGPIDDASMARGFVGFNSELFSINMASDYRIDDGKEQSIISVFAVFFTAVTGIVAGANLSGDLKDPSAAIPKGTLIAIAVTFTSYVCYPFLIAATVVRDASGDVDMLEMCKNESMYWDENILDCPVFTTASCSILGEGVDNPNGTETCEYGLENSSQVMELIAVWGPLIYIGCFAATLSSAIASLVGAPRVLQALAKDKLYPGIHFFAKGFGANNDPVRGYCLVFLLSFGCIMIGSLNAVSTLLSNFFLASYTLINVSCFHASLIKSPGWRPSFQYYNKWVSLVGAMLCLIVMFLIDYITALITFMITVFLYLFVSYRKPDVNWGSSTQGAYYVSALKSTLSLQSVKENVKNYRPQILMLSGQPITRPALLDLGTLFTKNTGLLVCGHIVESIDWRQRRELVNSCNDWMGQNKIKAFYDIMEGEDMEKGAVSMFQLVGLGKLKPNIVLIGYKNNWSTCPRGELKSYFNTLHDAFKMNLGIVLLRLQDGLDCSSLLKDTQGLPFLNPPPASPINLDDEENQTPAPPVNLNPVEQNMKKVKGESIVDVYEDPDGKKLTEQQRMKIQTFSVKQPKGNIDVWWLYDDGGLTLLLPYILSTRSLFGDCSLRIFALANRKDELDMEQRSMANLLSKFRIDYSDVIIIPGAQKKPLDQSKKEFDDLLTNFKSNEKDEDGCFISDAELQAQSDKTNRHIRLREILLENSSSANMIIMTLPLPRRGRVSAPLYMAWLEYITKGMPPFIFIRGNQQSVLTYYS